MPRSLNKAIIIGAVGREPEMRYTPAGQPVTAFTVGTADTWQDADGDLHEESECFNVVAWGNLAERCKQALDAGQLVYVEGRFKTRSWENRDGERCYRTEVVANDVVVLDGDAG
jgi:single-strand DNA-binding protein